MSRKFILIAPGLSSDQERTLLNRFRDRVAWWHQVESTWLLVDPHDWLTPTILRGLVQEASPTTDAIAMEVSPVDWALRLKTDRLTDASGWLTNVWQAP